MSPLALMSEGERAEIVSLHRQSGGRPKCPDCMEHIINMGLRPGKQVEMLTNSGRGPLLLKVDEARVALGRGIAMKIYVRRNKA
jgi:ferrous iron transport protein A